MVSRAPSPVAETAVAGRTFKSRALEQLSINAVEDSISECNDNTINNNEEEEEKEEENKKENVQAAPGKSTERVSVQNLPRYHHQERYQGCVHHRGSKYGRQKQQQRQYAHRGSKDVDLNATSDKVVPTPGADSAKSLRHAVKSESHSDLVRTSNFCFVTLLQGNLLKTDTLVPQARDYLKTSPTILIPYARTNTKTHTVTDRMKDSRLRGADLYVARLGWKKRSTPAISPPKSNTTQSWQLPLSVDIDNLPAPEPKVPTGSLHEELTSTSLSAPTIRQLPVCEKPPISASRPCYRCICYMQTVGIKRVFWTNNKGEWEGGKVRDLMDALDMAGTSSGGKSGGEGSAGGAAGNGVFVTKHEVLQLRRLMGS